MKRSLRMPLAVMLLLPGLLGRGWQPAAMAQDLPADEGILVVDASAAVQAPLGGRLVQYRQVSQDFLAGYEGLTGESSPPGDVSFNLDVRCIPWTAVESEDSPEAMSGQAGDAPERGVTLANECLLYFGEDAATGLPGDLQGLPFDDLLLRLGSYLERAVREQVAAGIGLFILREPAYPTSNLLGFTPSQWRRLVLQACKTIRSIAPGARIAIEVVPQYLPSRGYTPYPFLDNLIRDGAAFDLILLSFSPPISARFTRSGYPDPAWILSQLETYADLGRQFLVRFSGIRPLGPETEYQAWIDQLLASVYARPTVIGLYWNAVTHHPFRLTGVSWGDASTTEPDHASADRLMAFIRAHVSQGEVLTDSNGQAAIQAYAGEYAIRLAGDEKVTLAHIYRGEERRLVLPGRLSDATPAYVAPTPQTTNHTTLEADTLRLGLTFFILVLCMTCWGLYSRRSKARMKNPKQWRKK